MLDFSASWQQGYFRSSCGSPVVGERLSSPTSNKDISGGSTVTGARLSLLSSNKDISGGSPVAGARLSLSPSGKDIFTTEQVYMSSYRMSRNSCPKSCSCYKPIGKSDR